MKISPSADERIAVLETDNINFKRWQKSQDIAITEVRTNVATTDTKFDGKFDKLMFGIITELCATILVFIAVVMKGH
jgi:hypothetical protein